MTIPLPCRAGKRCVEPVPLFETKVGAEIPEVEPLVVYVADVFVVPQIKTLALLLVHIMCVDGNSP